MNELSILTKNKKIIKFEHASNLMNNSIRVEWNMGKRCNFDCSYCSSEIHDNHSPHVSLTIAENLLKKLIDWKKNQKICLNLSGGEPFVHPNIVEIGKMMFDLGFDWKSVNTNGSVGINRYLKTVGYFDHFTISWHFEHAREDHMKNLLLEMKNANAGIRCMLMFLPGQMKKIIEIKEFLEEKQIPVIVKRISPQRKNSMLVRPKTQQHNCIDPNQDYYSSEEETWLNQLDQKQMNVLKNVKITFEDGETIVVNDSVIRNQNLNRFFAWKCMAGVGRLVIHFDGSIYKGVCKQDGIIGNIFDSDFVLPKTHTTCTKKTCNCVGEIALLKWQDQNHAC